jgi:hypothetical protein
VVTSAGILIIPVVFFVAAVTAFDIPRVDEPALLVIENQSDHVLRNISLIAGTTGVGQNTISIREIGIGKAVVRSAGSYHETFFDNFLVNVGTLSLPKQGLAKGGSGLTVRVTVFNTDVSVVVERSKQ